MSDAGSYRSDTEDAMQRTVTPARDMVSLKQYGMSAKFCYCIELHLFICHPVRPVSSGHPREGNAVICCVCLYTP